MNAAQNKQSTTTTRSSQIGIIGLLAIVPCLSAAVFGSSSSNGPACLVISRRPALVFSEYLADYGPAPVAQQPMLTPIFYLRNNSTEKVKITHLQASCGCLAPSISATEVEPGAVEKLTLPIRLNNEPSGTREYTVTVQYVDPKPREVTLTVKAVLPEKSLIVEPRVLMVMGTVKAGQEHIVTISDFRPDSLEKPIHVTSVTGSSSLFTAELAGQFVREGASRTALSVHFRENPPLGRHRGLINVATDDELFPVIQIPVVVGDSKREPSDSVRVSPEVGRVVINTADAANSSGMVIAFDIPSRWKVTHCDMFPAGIVAKHESTPGSVPERQTVNVRLSVSELPTLRAEQAVLTLNATDNDTAEMVTVPIHLVWK
jgi:hypothetical protein